VRIFVTLCFQRRAAEAEMERRDRIAHLRHQAAGSAVPRAIGGAVDESDIIEMMKRRATAEGAASASDDDHHQSQKAEVSVIAESQILNIANHSPAIVESAAATLDGTEEDGSAASDDSGSSGGSQEEESSAGSWSGEEEEGGDSDIEEFYLKGGEGQIDEVEKKRKAAAEQKLVMVTAFACTMSQTLTNVSDSTRERAANEKECRDATLCCTRQAEVPTLFLNSTAAPVILLFSRNSAAQPLCPPRPYQKPRRIPSSATDCTSTTVPS
jgi:hypothetical protein